MDNFNQILACATRNVDQKYFLLSTAGGNNVYRERVYCYELYHQMRRIWPKTSIHTINGEIDKSGHSHISGGNLSNKIPDFLIHDPGSMDNNFAIIEVKTVNLHRSNIRKDLKKLDNFQKEPANYKNGIYLIFGHDAENKVDSIAEMAKTLTLSKSIDIWSHNEAGRAARCVRTLSP